MANLPNIDDVLGDPPPPADPALPSTTDVKVLSFSPEGLTFSAPSPTPAPAPSPSAEVPLPDVEDVLGEVKPETAKQEESRLSRLWEHIHPTRKESEGGLINEDLEKLPDWTDMPEMGIASHLLTKHPLASPLAQLGTLISGADETKDVIKEQFPGVKIEKKGAYLVMTSNEDGQKYAWKPGMRWSDATRALKTMPVAAAGTAAVGGSLMLAGAPAAASGIAGTIGGGLALEDLKALAGGGFNPWNVVGGVVLHGVGALAGKGLRAVRNLLPAADLGKNLAAAARGSSAAGRIVAGQVNPDPELQAAAQTLIGSDGRPLVESLTPAHLSQNPEYRSVANAAAGAEATHARARSGVGEVWTAALDAAGAPENQGALQAALEEGAATKLQAHKQLRDDLFAELFGADAVPAAEWVLARPAVKGLVPEGMRTPVPLFDAAVERTKDRLGTIPNPVQKFRNELFSGGATPTLEMIDRMRQKAGDEMGKGGGKLGYSVAKSFYHALDDIRNAAAETVSPGAAELLGRAKAADQVYRDIKSVSSQVFADGVQQNLVAKIRSAVNALAYGTPQELNRLMSVVPDRMKPDLFRFGLRQFVDRARNLDIPEVNDWFKAMRGNPESWKMVMKYGGPELAKKIELTSKFSTNIEAAMRAAAPRDIAGAFPEPWNIPGLVRKGLKLLGVAKSGNQLGPVGYTIADSINAPPTAIGIAMGEYLATPIARQVMTAQLRGTVPPGLIRATLTDPKFIRMAVAANIAPHLRHAWIESSANETRRQEPK